MEAKYLERIEAWVEALRSGDYKQGLGMLSNLDEKDIRHCCLGVACEVYNRRKDVLSVRIDDKETALPFKVAKWYGLYEDPPLNDIAADGEPVQYTATHWNDEMSATFDQIADMIEATYL